MEVQRAASETTDEPLIASRRASPSPLTVLGAGDIEVTSRQLPDGAAPVPATPPSAAATTPNRSPRKTWHARGLIGLLLMLLGLWIWLFWAEGAFEGGPNGRAFGADFAMFVGAAQVLRDGGNPFDHTVLFHTELRMLQRQGLPIVRQEPIVRVGNPPLFFWLLQPLTGLPFQPVAWLWIVLMYLLSGSGLIACLRYLGWKRKVLPALLFLLMPQVVLGAFYGNVIGLVFAALSWALALQRTRPFLAGMLLSVAVLKPPVALPIVLLIALFHPRTRVRLMVGFASAVALLFAFTLLFMDWRYLVLWVGGLLGYSRDIAMEPDVASLAGLYVRWAPHSIHIGLETLFLGVAGALTLFWWWRLRDHRETVVLSVSWLWFVWFLATPYAHFFDEIVLTLPVLALLGPDGRNVTHGLPAWGLYLMFFSLFLLSWTPFQAQLLSVTLLAVTVCLVLAARAPKLAAPAAEVAE